MSTVTHSCRCGATRFDIDVPGRWAGTRVTCYCKDCQTAAHLHAAGRDVLSPAGGTDVWQTTPDLIRIVAGAEHLKVIRLSPKGTYRWHAACCGTPMCNTTPNLKLPFAGIVLRQSEVPQIDKRLGPSRCHAFTAAAVPGAGAPKKDQGFARAGALVLKRMLTAWLSGRAQQNPLRRDDGTPIAPIDVISKQTRLAAIPAHLR